MRELLTDGSLELGFVVVLEVTPHHLDGEEGREDGEDASGPATSLVYHGVECHRLVVSSAVGRLISFKECE